MKALTLEEAVGAMQGKAGDPLPRLSITGVTTDSRTARPGQLFIALAGQRFDGHDFVKEAFERGATAAVVSRREVFMADFPRPVIWVPDTMVALGELAAYYRDQIAATVIAVTGSNGKTTVRGMIHQVLSGKYRGQQAPKSYNNQVGVPLTLLSAEGGDEFLVVELGSNHPGEIEALAKLARPDIGVVVSIGPAHLEGLEDLAGVIREKTSLFRRVRPGGLAVVNADGLDPSADLPEGLDLNVVSFGESAGADVRLTAFTQKEAGIAFQYNGRFQVDMPVLGKHNAVNALAAVVVARRLSVSDAEIAERLSSFAPPEMRLQRVPLGEAEVIFDAYNANPDSVAAALAVLEALPTEGRRVLVLGDMGELGPQSESLHRAVGKRVAAGKVDMLVTVGERSRVVAEECTARTACRHYPDARAAAKARKTWLRPGDLAMIKGSRVMKLERILEALNRGAEGAVTTR